MIYALPSTLLSDSMDDHRQVGLGGFACYAQRFRSEVVLQELWSLVTHIHHYDNGEKAQTCKPSVQLA